MNREKRDNSRISSRIPVEFLDRSKVKTYTMNVSRNGIFVKDFTEREINNLVRLRLRVPPDQTMIEVFGRVTWKREDESDGGYGIEFTQMESNDRDKWVEFADQVEKLDKLASGASESSILKQEKRKSERTTASFMVRFQNLQGLENFFSKNISEGGMFLATPVLKNVGEMVQVVVIHPETQKDIEISARVKRINPQTTTDEKKGMALEFVDLDENAKARLEDFLKMRRS